MEVGNVSPLFRRYALRGISDVGEYATALAVLSSVFGETFNHSWDSGDGTVRFMTRSDSWVRYVSDILDKQHFELAEC